MTGQRVPLRQRRDLGEIIRTSMDVYAQNFGPLFSIAALVIPLGIATGIFQSAIKDDTWAFAVVGALAVGQAVVNLIASAALISAVDDIAAGRAPDFTKAYDVATERFWTLVGAALRVAFHVVLLALTVIGIPWAIQRLVRWVFIQQAVILDGAKAKDALSRSAEVVTGSWWRTLGCWLLISLVALVPAVLLAGLFSFSPVAVSSAATATIDAILLPFVIIAMTLLYFDLQARKESNVPISIA